MEAKLWAAAAALEEHAALARHLAAQPGRALGDETGDGYRRLADRSTRTAKTLLDRLDNRGSSAPPVIEDHGRTPATDTYERSVMLGEQP